MKIVLKISKVLIVDVPSYQSITTAYKSIVMKHRLPAAIFQRDAFTAIPRSISFG